MKTAWADLPNAVYIDRILASLKANPEKWNDTFQKINNKYENYLSEAYMLTSGIIENLSRRHALLSATDVGQQDQWPDNEWNITTDAICALVGYDDCAYMLDSDPHELETLAKLGDIKALLLLTACTVFNTTVDNKT